MTGAQTTYAQPTFSIRKLNFVTKPDQKSL
jgi:hypothetical protein